MFKNLQKFGSLLKELRIKKGLTLRQACKIVDYDPSNWSKIERGLIPPPSNKEILKKWTKVLEIDKNEIQSQNFIDEALIAQGIIPEDILSQAGAADYLPAFFRTLRDKKPTQKEVDRLIELLRKA